MNKERFLQGFRNATIIVWLMAITVACSSAAPAQTRPHRRLPRPNARPISSNGAPQARYKAIWEPINYPDDIALKEVFFVTPRVGWISGKGNGGVLLHTSDGGLHWKAQLGDPQSTEPEFQQLQFIDQVHGWIVQDGSKLLRTSDGQNWEQAGTLPKFHPMVAVRFTSPRDGVFLGGYANNVSIFGTRDGGRNWKEVFACATRIQVNGLTHNTTCQLWDVTFPTARVGYAVGGAFNGGFAVVAKTEDGGNTWHMVLSTTEIETATKVFFASETNGYIVTGDNKIYMTSDGGKSWRGLVATASSQIPLRFADPEVGWSCWRETCSYTADGGQHWNSREYQFPAYINAFSVPRRDRVYLVGDHGMIYRYRVVLAEYEAQGILAAPSLVPYGHEMAVQLQQIRQDVQVLEAKLGAPAGQSSAAGSDAQSPDDATFSPDADPSQFQADGTGTTPSGEQTQTSGSDNATQFNATQDNTTQSDSSAGFIQDTNFTAQDAGTAFSPEMQNCCAAQLTSLQTDIGGFGQQVPTFSSRYRNLNLLFVGLNMFSDLVTKAHAVHDSFLALKKAPNLQAAIMALQDLSAKLDSTNQSISSGFQDLTAGSGGFGAVNNALGAAGGFDGATPNAGGITSTNGQTNTGDAQAQNQGSAAGSVVDKAADKAKKKLKKIIHF